MELFGSISPIKYSPYPFINYYVLVPVLIPGFFCFKPAVISSEVGRFGL